jgi:diaminobutyrate-2-oxoglutarate transaminase
MDDAIFRRRESEVRGYCRSFPAVFSHGEGSLLRAEDGREWIDLFCGAGTLSYGHNPSCATEAMVSHLRSGGVCHSLDLHTTAKRSFLAAFEEVVLAPRGLDYKVQFTGPTGTNAVEAAFKLARKATGRTVIAAFTNGYHGASLGALAATGNSAMRRAAGVPLAHTVFLPFDGYLGQGIDTIAAIARQLADASGGLDLPAAVVVETVQAEGGINVAGIAWLRRLHELCRRNGILLIVDDIQAGCGRTGQFFSFELADIQPDLVCLSKAVGGNGQPLSLVLIRRELDLWKPAEHNGTFRGNNLAFVAGEAVLRHHWSDPSFAPGIARRSNQLMAALREIRDAHPEAELRVRGRGLIAGLDCRRAEIAAQVSKLAFARGVMVERRGPDDQVVKFLPAFTIPAEQLARALEVVAGSVSDALAAPVAV